MSAWSRIPAARDVREGGHRFTRLEHLARWHELQARALAGEITDLRMALAGGRAHAFGWVEQGQSHREVLTSNKFSARRTVVDGIRFDSAREARRYCELKALERGGQVRNLELQPRYPLLVNGVLIGHYRADFRYTEVHTGRVVVEDAKGVRTRDYLLRKKLMRAVHGIDVREV